MRGQKDNIKEYESGLDWLTASSIKHHKSATEFRGLAVYLLNSVRGEGETKKEFGFGDYSGVQARDIQFVKRAKDGHMMLRFFGESTDFYAAEIIASGVPLKVTRIDGQITARFKEPTLRYGTTCRQRVEKADKKRGGVTQTTLALYKKFRADSGVTIGAREGAVYSRIYDWALKHQKITTFDLWRFEVELKEEAAPDFWNRYKLSENRPKLCAEMVKTRLEKVGVCETGFSHLEPCKISGTKKGTDIEAKQRYFVQTVLPYINKLSNLGLDDWMRQEAFKYGLTDEKDVFLPKKNT
jgi:hypothetical protein